jgi:RNA polymerase sigma-70 factor, ECF subfamily
LDPTLVERARAGDREAFALLAADSLGRLNAVARLILRDDDAADDAVQEALVSAWRSLRALRDLDRFGAWVNRLLIRACYDRSRRDSRRRVVEVRAAPMDEPMTPDSQASLALHDQLERSIGRLSTDQRAAIVAVYYLDLPLDEAAALLSIPVGTLKSRLHRSLDALHALVEADDRPLPDAKESIA